MKSSKSQIIQINGYIKCCKTLSITNYIILVERGQVNEGKIFFFFFYSNKQAVFNFFSLNIYWLTLHIIIILMIENSPSKSLYFRRRNKQAYSLTFRKQINIKSLSLLLSRKQSIQPENIKLIYKGRQINEKTSLKNIQDKGIIHIIDMSEVKQGMINVEVRYLGEKPLQFRVDSAMKVKDFIINQLENISKISYFHIGLIYVGQVMHPLKSFYQQRVEQDCEIIAVNISEFMKQNTNRKDLASIINHLDEKSEYHQNEAKDNIKSLTDQTKRSQIVDKSQNENRQKTKQADHEKRNNQMPFQTTKSNNVHHPGQQYQRSQNLLDSKPQVQRQLQGQQFQINNNSPNFEVKISKVDSQDSEQQAHNKVLFSNEQEIPISGDIYLQNQQPSKLVEPEEEMIRQTLDKVDLSAIDFIYIGNDHQSQTYLLIEKIVKQYQYLLS